MGARRRFRPAPLPLVTVPMFSLAAHTRLAVVDDDVVLLDVDADRYLCVPGGRGLLRPTSDRRGVAPASDDVAQALRGAGLLGPPAAAGRPVPARPAADLPETTWAMTPRDAWHLAGAVGDAAWRYHRKPLREIVDFVSNHAGDPSATDAGEVIRLAGLYRRAVAWLPLPRKCLIRSFVLLRFLQRSGVDAQWVFGVRTWPFSAHCWLQLGDHALDDDAERLVRYEPIFAVG